MAIYYWVLGVLHGARRPLVVAGTRDICVLFLALSGIVFVGPVELFVPPTATMLYGSAVWIFMGGLYLAVLSLIVMGMRPRLVVYNIRREELRPIVEEVVRSLDAAASWAGDAASLPTLGIAFHLEDAGLMRNVTLVATGEQASLENWKVLERTLQNRLQSVTSRRGFLAVQFLLVAAVLTLLVVGQLTLYRELVWQGLQELYSP